MRSQIAILMLAVAAAAASKLTWDET